MAPAALRLSWYEPLHTHPDVVARGPIPICAQRERQAHLLDTAKGRRILGALFAPLRHICLAIGGHPVLQTQTATERFQAIERASCHALAMFKAPAQLVDRHLLLDIFQDTHNSLRGKIERCVHPEWPPVRCDELDHLGQLCLHDRRLRHRVFCEVCNVTGSPDGVFAGTTNAEVVVALEKLGLPKTTL